MYVIPKKFFFNHFSSRFFCSNDLIPVVMGAHPDDFLATAPHNSYIHIESFATPKKLGEYLNHLIAHPVEYNKYFEWKGTGEFITTQFFCQLCAMIHYADLVGPPPRDDGPMVWNNDQAVNQGMCLPVGQWYWTRSNYPRFKKI